MAKRRTFSSKFKAQVVLDLLSGDKSLGQVSREYKIKDSVLSRWRQEFIERSPQVFERGKEREQEEERVAELERMVGRLTMELEVAKKASRLLL
jgi:transposase